MSGTECTETMMWKEINCTGSVPHARSGHTATLFGSIMYVFGGQSDSCFNDLYAFHIPERKWVVPSTSGTPPAPRNSHTATLVGSTIIVFGGCCGADQYFNDVCVLDLGLCGFYCNLV